MSQVTPETITNIQNQLLETQQLLQRLVLQTDALLVHHFPRYKQGPEESYDRSVARVTSNAPVWSRRCIKRHKSWGRCDGIGDGEQEE